jgi:hypothetical protein
MPLKIAGDYDIASDDKRFNENLPVPPKIAKVCGGAIFFVFNSKPIREKFRMRMNDKVTSTQ